MTYAGRPPVDLILLLLGTPDPAPWPAYQCSRGWLPKRSRDALPVRAWIMSSTFTYCPIAGSKLRGDFVI